MFTVDRATGFFKDRLGVSMERPRRFGGMGTLGPGRFPPMGKQIFAGEAAGLQDALWGFGMRFAIRSGVLAARRAAWIGDLRGIQREERYLESLYRAGRVNRSLYSRIGNRGYAELLRWMAQSADPRAWLARRYAPSLWKTVLTPLAGTATRPRATADCEQEGCDCTWCRCHRSLAPAEGAG